MICLEFFLQQNQALITAGINIAMKTPIKSLQTLYPNIEIRSHDILSATGLFTDSEVENITKSITTPILWNTNSEGFNFTTIDNVSRLAAKTPHKQIIVFGTPALQSNIELWKTLEEKYSWSEANIGIVLISTWALYYAQQMEEKYKNYFNSNDPFTKRFLFLNHGDKSSRSALLGLFSERDLLKHFYYSYVHHPDSVSWHTEEMISGLDKLTFPKTLDNVEEWFGNTSYDEMLDMCPGIQKFFKDSAMGVITETGYETSENINHLIPDGKLALSNIPFLEHYMMSEKTCKFLAAKRPFILVGRTHGLRDLRQMGFKTFSPFINESYDEIQNDQDRIQAIALEVERLCKMDLHEFAKVKLECEKIAQHNYNTLANFTEDPIFYNI